MSEMEEKSNPHPREEKDIRTASFNSASSDSSGQIGPYKIISILGEGGFGMVYIAEQIHPIKRLVALKVIKPGMDTRLVIARFETERQALAMMDHPNIAHVYDAGTTEAGRPYFAMEYIKGIPITQFCDKYKMGIEDRLRLFIPICQAIQHAHHKGIIHRDIKPSNVLVVMHDEKPIPKIIDFGVAKALNQRLTERTLFTAQGQLVGTPEYMSPEQAELTGLDVDTRTDIYSLGVLLYELLAGCTPFDSEELRSKGYAQMQHIICEQDPLKPSTKLTTLGGKVEDIAKHHSATIDQLRKSVRGDLDWIVMKCLEKDPRRRYGTAEALVMDIQHHLNNEPVMASPPSNLYRFGKLLRRKKVTLKAAAPMMVVLCVLGLFATLYLHRQNRIHWAKDEALPRIEKLINERKSYTDNIKAYKLALKVEKIIPNDPRLAECFNKCAVKMSITTEPQGATVYMKDYKKPKDPWKKLGVTPIDDMRLPLAVLRLKFEKEEHETVLAACNNWDMSHESKEMSHFEISRKLDRKGKLPSGMVRVSVVDIPGSPHYPDFFIDTNEVTNRQFKKFVDDGGYQKKKYWKEPFIKTMEEVLRESMNNLSQSGLRTLQAYNEGVTLNWEDAVKEFVDRTGQPGPATWRDGTYPSGQDEYPVSGVSWYEAAAYAEWAGKSLPTVEHWGFARGDRTTFVEESASTADTGALISEMANFRESGPSPVGSHPAIMPFGEYDMAGNVQEWCRNETRIGHVIRGGAWGDAIYMFGDISHAPSFNRSERNGFRCVRLSNPENIPELCFESIEPVTEPNLSNIPRLPDNELEMYKQWFAYDKTPLEASVEPENESATNWIQQKITFNAAYGKNERVIAHLYLPKKAAPPYQTVIFFPGIGVTQNQVDSTNPSDLGSVYYIPPLIDSGRAVLYPVYKGTYERNTDDVRNIPVRMSEIKGTVEERELLIKIVKDFMRSVDYLETRGDINKDALAYVGYSWGGRLGAIIPALEKRIKVNVLMLGGIGTRYLPEVNEINYVKRVEQPTLMLNGKYDPLFPYNSSSKPMYDSLGTEKKHQILYDYPSHYLPPDEAKKDMLGWLDKYLGPVKGVER